MQEWFGSTPYPFTVDKQSNKSLCTNLHELHWHPGSVGGLPPGMILKWCIFQKKIQVNHFDFTKLFVTTRILWMFTWWCFVTDSIYSKSPWKNTILGGIVLSFLSKHRRFVNLRTWVSQDSCWVPILEFLSQILMNPMVFLKHVIRITWAVTNTMLNMLM